MRRPTWAAWLLAAVFASGCVPFVRKDDGLTYPSDRPRKRIDYVFLTGTLRCTAAEVIDTKISDDRPLLVTLQGNDNVHTS
jgi:endonuclease/exonuclease/phosphatase family metal-dependent hydrolase